MTSKVTHDIVLDGGMVVCPDQDNVIRFFSKSRLKNRDEFVGPAVAYSKNIDSRFLNLILYSPILYQATQRAKLDAMDIEERIGQLAASVSDPEHQHECLAILAQLIKLRSAIEVAQSAAIDGIDLDNVPG